MCTAHDDAYDGIWLQPSRWQIATFIAGEATMRDSATSEAFAVAVRTLRESYAADAPWQPIVVLRNSYEERAMQRAGLHDLLAD